MAGLLNAAATPDAVTRELVRWGHGSFDLVTANCGLGILGYVGRATAQPVPLWLKAFGRVGIARLMRRDDAFVAVGRRALAQMGCPETVNPRRGDVGLVRLPGGLTAALCLGDQWAARSDHGFTVSTAECEIAWRVVCPQR